MELSVLKSVFFVGEENAIDTFVGTLKPRCIQPSDVMVNENGGIYRTLYNSEDGTYISPSLTVYFESPVSGKLFPVSTKITIDLHYSEHVYIRNDGARRGHYIRTATLSSEELSEYYVEIGNNSGKYAKKDNPELLELINGDQVTYAIRDNIGTVGFENSDYKSAFVYENENMRCVPNKMYFANMLTKVYCEHGRRVVYVLNTYLTENSELFETCPECRRVYLKADHMICESGKCLNCECQNIRIYHYHGWNEGFTPHYVEGENRRTTVTFGTEVETQGPDSNKRFVAPYQDIWHLERDGSIGAGFEMISQPMSLEYVKAHKDDFEKMFNDLQNNGQRGHDASDCGLHVHINRGAFKDDKAIQRFKAMVHGMRAQMEKFARRTSSEYYHYCNVSRNFSYDEISRIDDYGHHTAVNATGNTSNEKNTVEIRIFKSTLNVVTYIATLEFVNNLVAIANDSSKIVVKFGDLLHGEYIEKYVEQRRQYNVTFNEDAMVDFGYAETKETLDKAINGTITKVEFMNMMEAFADSRLVEGGAI